MFVIYSISINFVFQKFANTIFYILLEQQLTFLWHF